MIFIKARGNPTLTQNKFEVILQTLNIKEAFCMVISISISIHMSRNMYKYIHVYSLKIKIILPAIQNQQPLCPNFDSLERAVRGQCWHFTAHRTFSTSLQPHRPERSQSHLISEAKQGWAWLGLGREKALTEQDMPFEASLAAQWQRTHLLMPGTRVQALVREDLTCRGAAQPQAHTCWAWALRGWEPQVLARVLQPPKPGPSLRSTREACALRWRSPCSPQLKMSPHKMETQRSSK